MQLKPEKVKVVIGSGGKTIRKIVEDTGAQIGHTGTTGWSRYSLPTTRPAGRPRTT